MMMRRTGEGLEKEWDGRGQEKSAENTWNKSNIKYKNHGKLVMPNGQVLVVDIVNLMLYV